MTPSPNSCESPNLDTASGYMYTPTSYTQTQSDGIIPQPGPISVLEFLTLLVSIEVILRLLDSSFTPRVYLIILHTHK